MNLPFVKKIAVLPGDGIGVEVTHEAVKIVHALGLPIELEWGDIGWECWKKEGNPVPQRTWDLIARSDLTLLGAITSMPKREAQESLPAHLKALQLDYVSPIIQLRQHLDLYANVRPCFNVKGGVNDFNFSIIRENTEGLYAGFDYHPIPEHMHGLLQEHPKWKAQDVSKISASLRLQSEAGLLRLYRFAFAYAHENRFSRVTLADKPNVLRHSSAFARQCFESVAPHYPHIKADILNVDAVALWLVKRPEEFGVIVAENMFGDILSDLGAGVMGGLGFAPSANIGEKGAYFEPVHGSAPRVASGKANPSAMFLTCAMMLRHIGYTEEALRIQQAVARVVKKGKHVTYDLGGNATTAEMADAIVEETLYPKPEKTIAFLATGSELLNGDLLESNTHRSSSIISASGGVVKTKVVIGDSQRDIAEQLRRLLDTHDAVITIGGLGPTSDDRTRFALSDATQLPLKLDDASWEHVQNRLHRFGLNVTESNQQQALFPERASVYKNEWGTANACHLQWNGRDIFMLPGPPKEYFPLFEHVVVPYLNNADYFNHYKIHRYLTLGLIEGEISQKMDAIVANDTIHTAYRWHYPYLEIKITVAKDTDARTVLAEIDNVLEKSIVSKDGTDAQGRLDKQQRVFTQRINVIMPKATQMMLNTFQSDKVHFFEKEGDTSSHSVVYFQLQWPSKEASQQILKMSFIAQHHNEVVYEHQLNTPKREADIEHFIRSYFAWQLAEYMSLLSRTMS